jgi:hypothetical protein
MLPSEERGMSESPLGEGKNGSDLDEYAISELKRFFLLLDKWDREASQDDPKATPPQGPGPQRDFDTL